MYAAFQRSWVGRHSVEYYRDSVTLLLAQGGPSRILTYSTSLARFRCPFASLNGVISHRFPQRAFHWSAEPQCISHPSFLDVYCGNVATGAIYNDGRGFRRWSARFGNSASPWHAGQSGLTVNAFGQARLCCMLLSSSGFPSKLATAPEVIHSQPLLSPKGIEYAPMRRTRMCHRSATCVA